MLDASPKAAATLARRCLQGMIRDFWTVQGKKTLKAEIDAIKDRIDPDDWRAIDAVREVGNIGAHMEQDVNLMIDVARDEAEALIQLIELLLADWYVGRAHRQRSVLGVIEIAKTKAAAIATAEAQAAAKAPTS